MPEHAAHCREQAAEGRCFAVDHQQVSFAGTSTVHSELDLADALDLDAAVAAGAAELAALGSEDSLDVRRAAAVGHLARGDLPLALDGGDDEEHKPGPVRRRGTGREVVLYVHLAADAIRSQDPDAPARVENAGGRLLTAGQVAAWCGSAATTRVMVRPVLDLAEKVRVDAYEVPDRLAEQVRLRDHTCVFPWCTRPARCCDTDHVLPYDPDGPPGQTSEDNLAPLCRRHHRLKTHGPWRYTMLEPGSYLWRSPHGYTWLRDHTGTTDLTPPPLAGPTTTGHPPDQ